LHSRSRLSLDDLADCPDTAIDVASDEICDQIPHCHRRRQFFKGAIDLLGSIVLIVVLFPLFAIVALLIRVVDGPPIIYRRRVLGIGRHFDAYKFRTMCPGADAMLAADADLQKAYTQQFKLKADPRVTGLGAWLRRYSLDELPQLFNVLRGQMSLVGPRMITASELERYGRYQRLLRTVKPGLTGYWQVQGRQNVSYAERVRMDVYYITHWSILLDVVILLRTPARVIFSEGAY
jgi:lipopolysaccharide/colanic/teichoic acid biosynthesis glycosyltransferase